jgi:predicted RNase H-like nuclease
MAVRARSVSAYEVPCRASLYRSCRAARVRFHTTRTQPNVRAKAACCVWSGYARHWYAVLTFIADRT